MSSSAKMSVEKSAKKIVEKFVKAPAEKTAKTAIETAIETAAVETTAETAIAATAETAAAEITPEMALEMALKIANERIRAKRQAKRYYLEAKRKNVRKSVKKTIDSIFIPLTDTVTTLPCGVCATNEELGRKYSIDFKCPCRDREYVTKEQMITYLLLTEEERKAQNVVFGPDLVQLDHANLDFFNINTEQFLRLFFFMFTDQDLYANKDKNGEINLFAYEQNDPLDEGQIEGLLVQFNIDKHEYLHEYFQVMDEYAY